MHLINFFTKSGFFIEQRRYKSDDLALACALTELMNVKVIDNPHHVEQQYLGFQRLVAAEFSRKVYNSNFKRFPIDQNVDKLVEQRIEAETNLWIQLYKCIQVLDPRIYVGFSSTVFFNIICENQLVGLGFEKIIQNDIPSVREVCRGSGLKAEELSIEDKYKQIIAKKVKVESKYPGYTKQNDTLENGENPFNETKCPFTWAFIEEMRLKSAEDQDFKIKYFSPLIKARSDLAYLIEYSKTRKEEPNKPQNNTSESKQDQNKTKRYLADSPHPYIGRRRKKLNKIAQT